MAIGVSRSSIARPIESRLAAPQEPGRGFKHLDQPLFRTPSVTASLRPSDQKPRHPVTCSTCARKYAGTSLVDTARACLSTKTWSAGMLTCSRRSALRYPKAYGFVFLGGARFPPSWDLATTARSLQQHQFVHSRASHASSPPQKVGFSGHYCVAGLRARSLTIICNFVP